MALSNKLTDEQIREIKKHLTDERRIRQVWIAKQFGVTQATIAYYNRQLKNNKEK
jgi:predicted transcriptional regulator